MAVIIALALVSLLIVILYASALLIFTPYEEDDKYLLKIMESGFRVHDWALKGPKFLRKTEDGIAKFILGISYFILKDRKYIDDKK
ncbi:hypothetical protein PM10SUCC1_23960 [Propionigenium maris DSM 9537]|uniref:Uncharacterized protein n=1 Tax=Propionigenium maris DSM 9537 TaxID=1123000 RepID=A0A9W6LNS3_9FUSO|nr:hypothetical protein [Propionigenium maris]GLI56882.1 hypothetical protein PM10SUCC1_23960 [Propionigenium maris DSM 9537]